MSIEAMKQALEALENSQRFVEASANAKMLHGWGGQLDTAEDSITSLRQAIAEAEKQEPVAWCSQCGHKCPHPQPEREPLTDEQIAEISVECATVTPSDIYFARAIEAAHGIKGEA